MANKHVSYLKKLQRLKKYFYPVVDLLDKTRIFPVLVPAINFSLKKIGVNKRFQKDLNYRLIAKATKNSFVDAQSINYDKLMIIPFIKGADNLFLIWSFAIAKKMKEKGYDSLFVVCDKVLPICHAERLYKTREEDKHICANCFNGYDHIIKSSKANFEFLSTFVENHQLENENAKIDRMLSIEECENYVFQNAPIGKLNYTAVMRYFQTGEMEYTEEFLLIYKKFLKAGAMFCFSWNNMIKQLNLNPDLVLIFNGSLSSEAFVVDYCINEKITYVTHECFYGANSWMYRVNGDVMNLTWDDKWEEFSKKELTPKQKNKAAEFMGGFRRGEKSYIRYNYEYPLSKEFKKDEFVVLFTNLNFDTAVLGRNPVFKSMYEWIEEVIRYWNKNKIETKLVIRVHPAEGKTLSVTKDFVKTRVGSLIEHNKNIHLYDSLDEVDSYSLIENMKFSLVYASTIGLETAIMGKVFIVAGNAHYRYKSFSLFHENKEDYFKEIETQLKRHYPSNQKSNDALKYAYFLFFVCIKKFDGLETDHVLKVNEFNFENLDELIEKNEDLLMEFQNEVTL
jgi:hypothetical protein